MEQMSVNGKLFDVIKLLGHGKGGYSYLVTDGTKEYVLKQIHHEPCDYYQFGKKIESEMKDYERLQKIGSRMPEMFDVDVKEERILKEMNYLMQEHYQMEEDYYKKLDEAIRGGLKKRREQKKKVFTKKRTP